MISGKAIILRARTEQDVPILHHELYEDLLTYIRSDPRAWLPRSVDDDTSPYALRPRDDSTAAFSIAMKSNEELVGAITLWGIDRHNRSAHIGISIFSAFRGRGIGSEAVPLVRDYATQILGLHRLQIETNSTNHAMRALAQQSGFVLEGTLRESAWVDGAFSDEVLFAYINPST